jgi:hypothetical protein
VHRPPGGDRPDHVVDLLGRGGHAELDRDVPLLLERAGHGLEPVPRLGGDDHGDTHDRDVPVHVRLSAHCRNDR